MSLLSSLPKSTKTAFLGIATIAASLLAIQVLPTSPQRIQHSPSQLVENPIISDEADNHTALLLTIAAVGGAVGVGLAASKNQHGRSSSPRLQFSPTRTATLDQASRKLQKRLLLLLHEDRQAATRLLAQVKFNHPNRSTDWCVEKVIYDLERDRGSR